MTDTGDARVAIYALWYETFGKLLDKAKIVPELEDTFERHRQQKKSLQETLVRCYGQRRD